MVLGAGGYRLLILNRVYIPYLSPALNQEGLQRIYVRKVGDGIYEQVTNIPQYNGIRTEEYLEGEIVNLEVVNGEVAAVEVEGEFGRRVVKLRPGTPELVLTQDMEKVDENYLEKGMKVRVYVYEGEDSELTSHKILIL